ncbi:MAG: adenylate/guanylate cyclase domain-containing protein [Rhizobiales bacterium PAR1]|nr:MAG: adenylate/guanylate cyclase domain-containing protein [Rhizobiales bacterium PAR1]
MGALATDTQGHEKRRWLQRFGWPRVLGVLVLLALTLLKYSDPAPLERLRLALFDQAMASHPRVTGDSPVVIVDLDEASLARIGQWPWSRGVMARLVEASRDAGAVAIGFDIVFPEPDRLSPKRLAERLPGLTRESAEALRRAPDTDVVFADALRSTRVVLGRSGLPDMALGGSDPHLPIAMMGGNPLELMPSYPGVLRNLPELEAAAAGVGMFSVLPEQDGILRRVPLAFNVGGVVRPTLAIELLRVATGGDALAIKRDSAGISGFVVGGNLIPTERDGRFWINFSRHAPERFVSAADLLDGKIAPERLKDKLVLIGSSAIGLQDLRATPVEAAMPGVEIHAQALETILSGAMLTRPNYAAGAEILAGALLALIMIALVPRLGTLPVLALGLVLGGVTFWAGRFLFTNYRLLIDVVYPLLAGFSVFLTLVFANYWREERQKRAIRAAFQHYLAPSLVERLANEPHLLRLGGETRVLTVLFADLRGFTRVAESYREDPQALTALMNRLMSTLSEAIIGQGGTIDKYMGDAVMAFWNAPLDEPDHAAKAARAALEMQRRMSALEVERLAEARIEGRTHLPLAVGIGLNTGACVVGNMGSEFRFDYTALGDAVNLASRLEGLTAQYDAPILVGEATAQLLKTRFTLSELGETAIRGKQKVVRIFALKGTA